MSPRNSDTEQILSRAGAGDQAAVNELMALHRKRLRQMIAIRMDATLTTRVDPSDVVQETLAEASRRLPEYIRTQPLPFYPWLRQLAWDRLVALYRFHKEGKRRSVDREEEREPELSDESIMSLANRFATSASSPSQHMVREEARERVRAALKRLPEPYREAIVMRHLEQLSIQEIALIAGISEGTVKSRLARGVLLLGQLLSDTSLGGSR